MFNFIFLKSIDSFVLEIFINLFFFFKHSLFMKVLLIAFNAKTFGLCKPIIILTSQKMSGVILDTHLFKLCIDYCAIDYSINIK